MRTAHRAFTFRSRAAAAPELLRFLLSSAVGFLIALASPLLLVRGLGMPSLTAVAATCVVVPVFTYAPLALFVFARRPVPTP